MSARFIRQGDVCFVKISDDPNYILDDQKDTIDTSKELIFAHGEQLGAVHRADEKWLPKVKAYTTADVNRMILRAFKGGDVVHDKPHVDDHVGHQAAPVAKGTYYVTTQREHSQGITRRVID